MNFLSLGRSHGKFAPGQRVQVYANLSSSQAAVDIETDALLQTTLRSNIFKDRTIITIAHRINTILDSDRVLVLKNGEIAEFDTPLALVRLKGLFYQLVREAGLLDSVA